MCVMLGIGPQQLAYFESLKRIAAKKKQGKHKKKLFREAEICPLQVYPPSHVTMAPEETDPGTLQMPSLEEG